MTELIFFTGVYLFIVSPVTLAVYLWHQPRERWGAMGFFLAVSLGLAYGLGLVASSLFYNPLPFVVGDFTPIIPHAPDNGLPSHHALFTASLAAVATVWNRKLGAFLWIITLLVGMGRIYGGVHHPVDIFAGIGLAIFSVFISFIFFKHTRKSFSGF